MTWLKDYDLMLQDYSPSEQMDEKLWLCLQILRSTQPDLVIFSGDRKHRLQVRTRSDLQEVRTRLASQYGSNSVVQYLLYLGVSSDHTFGTLTQNELATPGFYRLIIALEREGLDVLCGDPPVGAKELFSELVSEVHPYMGTWREWRNSVLVHCTTSCKALHAESPESYPSAYPSDAIPCGWLVPGVMPNEYPDGVWWFNYWSKPIVEEFGVDVMRSLPVPHVQELDNGGFLFGLCDEPFTIDRPDHLRIQRQALEHLDFREHQLGWVPPKERAWSLDRRPPRYRRP